MKNQISSLFYIVLFFASLLHLSIDAQTKVIPKPNILWIISEDNSPYFGVYGDKIALTPNVDKLAQSGVVYKHAFSNAPVCAPSRNTIITGMFANSIGNHQMRSLFKAPSFVRLFPNYLKEAGYFTSNNKKEDYNVSKISQPWSEGWHESSDIASYKNRKPGQPFFHVANLGGTHETSLFDSIPDNDLLFKPSEMVVFPYHPNTSNFRHDYAQYYHRVNKLDAQIGVIINDLKKNGLFESTIIFYFSDHGGVLPRGKRYLYESGLRVPMVVHVPEMYRHLMPDVIGSQTDRLVSFVDLAPSVLSLAGIKIPDYMQGQPFLGENVLKSKDYVFGFRGRMDEATDLMHTARNRQFRYIRNYYPERIYGQYIEYLWFNRSLREWEKLFKENKLNDAQAAYWKTKPYEELYDIVNDPHNINNLAKNPKYIRDLKELSDATDKWIENTKPMDVFPEPMMVDIDKKGVLWDVLKDKDYPLMKIHEVARMSAKADKKDFNQLYAYIKDKNTVIAFWGIKAMFQYSDEMKVPERLNELRKNLTHPELYIQNLTANVLISIGEKPDCKEVITSGINSNNNFNRLEGLLLYKRIALDKDIDESIKTRYASIKTNGYEQSVIDKIYGITKKHKKSEQ